MYKRQAFAFGIAEHAVGRLIRAVVGAVLAREGLVRADGKFRLKVLQSKREHHLSCTQTAMHFCLDVVTVCLQIKNSKRKHTRAYDKNKSKREPPNNKMKKEQAETQQENKRISKENCQLCAENDCLKN